jgi:hypothetical protein
MTHERFIYMRDVMRGQRLDRASLDLISPCIFAVVTVEPPQPQRASEAEGCAHLFMSCDLSSKGTLLNTQIKHK